MANNNARGMFILIILLINDFAGAMFGNGGTDSAYRQWTMAGPPNAPGNDQHQAISGIPLGMAPQMSNADNNVSVHHHQSFRKQPPSNYEHHQNVRNNRIDSKGKAKMPPAGQIQADHHPQWQQELMSTVPDGRIPYQATGQNNLGHKGELEAINWQNYLNEWKKSQLLRHSQIKIDENFSNKRKADEMADSRQDIGKMPRTAESQHTVSGQMATIGQQAQQQLGVAQHITQQHQGSQNQVAEILQQQLRQLRQQEELQQQLQQQTNIVDSQHRSQMQQPLRHFDLQQLQSQIETSQLMQQQHQNNLQLQQAAAGHHFAQQQQQQQHRNLQLQQAAERHHSAQQQQQLPYSSHQQQQLPYSSHQQQQLQYSSQFVQQQLQYYSQQALDQLIRLLDLVDLGIRISLLPIPGADQHILMSLSSCPSQSFYRSAASLISTYLLHLNHLLFDNFAQKIRILREWAPAKRQTTDILERILGQIYGNRTGEIIQMAEAGGQIELEKRLWNLRVYRDLYGMMNQLMGPKMPEWVAQYGQLARKWVNAKLFLEANIREYEERIAKETKKHEDEMRIRMMMIRGMMNEGMGMGSSNNMLQNNHTQLTSSALHHPLNMVPFGMPVPPPQHFQANDHQHHHLSPLEGVPNLGFGTTQTGSHQLGSAMFESGRPESGPELVPLPEQLTIFEPTQPIAQLQWPHNSSTECRNIEVPNPYPNVESDRVEPSSTAIVGTSSDHQMGIEQHQGGQQVLVNVVEESRDNVTDTNHDTVLKHNPDLADTVSDTDKIIAKSIKEHQNGNGFRNDPNQRGMQGTEREMVGNRENLRIVEAQKSDQAQSEKIVNVNNQQKDGDKMVIQPMQNGGNNENTVKITEDTILEQTEKLDDTSPKGPEEMVDRSNSEKIEENQQKEKEMEAEKGKEKPKKELIPREPYGTRSRTRREGEKKEQEVQVVHEENHEKGKGSVEHKQQEERLYKIMMRSAGGQRTKKKVKSQQKMIEEMEEQEGQAVLPKIVTKQGKSGTKKIGRERKQQGGGGREKSKGEGRGKKVKGQKEVQEVQLGDDTMEMQKRGKIREEEKDDQKIGQEIEEEQKTIQQIRLESRHERGMATEERPRRIRQRPKWMANSDYLVDRVALDQLRQQNVPEFGDGEPEGHPFPDPDSLPPSPSSSSGSSFREQDEEEQASSSSSLMLQEEEEGATSPSRSATSSFLATSSSGESMN